jgi:hypothetical protein
MKVKILAVHSSGRFAAESRLPMKKRVHSLLLGALCSLGLGLVACDEKKPDAGREASAAAASASAPAALTSQAVTATGENYCLGCGLKKGQGAAAQCSVYGHRHALRVETATGEDGAPLPSLAGQTLHYLDNDRSAALLAGEALHNARVQVKGKLFAPERTLEVGEVETL